MGNSSRMSNPEFSVPVTNFYISINAAGDRKTLEFLLDNLLGSFICHIQWKISAIPSETFVNLYHDNIV